MITRAYIQLRDGRQAHYRRAGAGEPLILLHPSPLSSAWMEPVIEALLDIADAIAPDTPGYGASDPLPAQSTRSNGNGQRSGPTVEHGGKERQSKPTDDLTPYTQWLHEFILALGFRQMGLYGSATGAQIAIEFARAYPEATRFLVLDNVAHFTAEEREGMLARYFPDLSPRADGRHLKTAWAMARGLWQWFPWYEQVEEHRIAEPEAVPLEVTQRMLLDHLGAGPEYARAYRAAMRNEDAARMQDIAVPARIIRWQGGLLRRYADRLDGFRWPKHIRMVPCGPTMEERLDAIRRAVNELDAATIPKETPETNSVPPQVRPGQVATRR